MVINEDKINEMIQKEIEEQVKAKLKQIGRQTITDLYKKVMEEQVQSFLIQQQKETLKELNLQIEIEKDYWKKEVLDSIRRKFNDKIDDLFVTNDNEW